MTRKTIILDPGTWTLPGTKGSQDTNHLDRNGLTKASLCKTPTILWWNHSALFEGMSIHQNVTYKRKTILLNGKGDAELQRKDTGILAFLG